MYGAAVASAAVVGVTVVGAIVIGAEEAGVPSGVLYGAVLVVSTFHFSYHMKPKPKARIA